MAKLRVKDLAAELSVGNREVLQVLRDLDIPVKSHMSSLEDQQVDLVRQRLSQSGGSAEVTTKEIQPGVVRRRRKRSRAKAGEAPEAPVKAPEPEAPVEEPPVEAEAEASAAPEKPEVPVEPEAPAQAEVEKAAEAEEPAPKPRGKKKVEPVQQTARIITPAGVEPPAPEAPEAPVEEAQPEEAPEAPPAEAEAPAEEVAPAAEAAEPEEAPAEPEAPAEEEAPAAEAPAEEKKAEKAAKAEEAEDEDAKNKKTEKFSGSQVKVIARPDPNEKPAKPSRPARPAGGRPPREGAAPGGGAGRRKDRRVVEFKDTPAAEPGKGAAPAPGQQQQPSGRRKDARGPKGKKGRKGAQQGQRPSRFEELEAAAKLGPPPKTQPTTAPMKAQKRKLRIEDAIRVSDMAHQMGVKAPELMRVLMSMGIMATINQSLDLDTASVVASEFGYEVERVGFSEEEFIIPTEADKPEDLKARPPVVTIMGHVDHGKTSLLDAIRSSDVTGGEAGGITQHIGAYHVTTGRGDVVFLDTPGHEAFTAMRARGANVTDIVILVVAADDGVMDQTREAVNHSKAAGVPIVVAVNKIDKEDADPDRPRRELADMGLVPEEWGGETIFTNVSAKQRLGLDELLELLLLQSEVLELQANPDKPARGHIVEARLDRGRGPVGTLLVQEGTLRAGDAFVCGLHWGKVRAMFDDTGKRIKEAGPAMPVEVQGFDGVPEAGDEFVAVADEKVARKIADDRQTKQRERELAKESKVTLESFLQSRPDQEVQTLNLVLKADVQGSLEAINEALVKLSTDKVKVDIIHTGAGAITESDILLASASDAVIIGFNVRPTAKIKEVAEQENVDIRFYDIIYKLVDDIKAAMTGMLAPVVSESYLGQAEVRETFHISRIGTVAGSYVTDGKMKRDAKIRLLRDGVVIHTGELSSLKRFKDDAKEVAKGYECGMTIKNFNDIKEGDVIEAFEMVEEAATL
ncbi:translation initiation factor IF-2 [Desulfohalovibrio reitneri]|uniref:translation initiation factor IF-2 n=1 Tax=Desulfohalovibrio reitneri TaxID=1307759 RepID=UPI0004A70F0B|nr:translation initiation factor IF-2 [Desulfohalovibrio reitneri]